MRVFENKVAEEGIFTPSREVIRGEWRKLCKKGARKFVSITLQLSLLGQSI
jgi:hypothetical protein